MRTRIALVTLGIAVAFGCSAAPTPMTAHSGATDDFLAASKASVSVGQINSLPVRCPCFALDGTIGAKRFVIGFEQQKVGVSIEKFEVDGKHATEGETAAIAKGVLAEAKEAQMQESTMSAERARQLFAVAAALDGKGGGDSNKFGDVQVSPTSANSYQLEAKLGTKSVEINYQILNGFAGPAYEIRSVEVGGKRPTADDIKAIVAGLNAEADIAMTQETTNSGAKARLYRALAKALAN